MASSNSQRQPESLPHGLPDELVYAGQFNTDLGYPILGNAARSVHQGVELAARVERRVQDGISTALDANATFSDNHFVEYREQYGPTPADEVVYDGNAIPAFPSVIANIGGQASWAGARLGAAVRYVGRIYVDATESQASSIDPHTVLDLFGGYAFPAGASRVHLGIRVFNAFDAHYETAGYLDYDSGGNLVPHLVPAATRNVLFEVKVDW